MASRPKARRRSRKWPVGRGPEERRVLRADRVGGALQDPFELFVDRPPVGQAPRRLHQLGRVAPLRDQLALRRAPLPLDEHLAIDVLQVEQLAAATPTAIGERRGAHPEVALDLVAPPGDRQLDRRADLDGAPQVGLRLEDVVRVAADQLVGPADVEHLGGGDVRLQDSAPRVEHEHRVGRPQEHQVARHRHHVQHAVREQAAGADGDGEGDGERRRVHPEPRPEDERRRVDDPGGGRPRERPLRRRPGRAPHGRATVHQEEGGGAGRRVPEDGVHPPPRSGAEHEAAARRLELLPQQVLQRVRPREADRDRRDHEQQRDDVAIEAREATRVVVGEDQERHGKGREPEDPQLQPRQAGERVGGGGLRPLREHPDRGREHEEGEATRPARPVALPPGRDGQHAQPGHDRTQHQNGGVHGPGHGGAPVVWRGARAPSWTCERGARGGFSLPGVVGAGTPNRDAPGTEAVPGARCQPSKVSSAGRATSRRPGRRCGAP